MREVEEMEENKNEITNSENEITNESELDLLKDLRSSAKKQSFYAKLSACFTGGIFVVVIVVVLVILPQVRHTVDRVNTLADRAEVTMDNADAMIESVTETSENANVMIVNNLDNFTESMENLSNLDLEGLNQAISDLQDAVGPFAKLFGSSGK